MTAGRRIRQRQDLRTVPQFERELNDVGARDAYEQLLLDSIRAGTNPNDKAVVEVYEGYVEPHYDAVHGRQVMHQHREAMRQLFGEREVILRTLRASAEHQSKSPFEQLLLETEFYTGIREWGGSASSTNNNNNRREVRSSQNSQLMDREDSSTGTDTMLHLTTTPAYIRGSLRAYQLEGVNWLLGLFSKGINGILADEMGLGKTFQTIATLAYLKFTVGMPGPHLVVCPKSVMGNWFREFKHWCPALAVYKYHAPSHIRPGLLKAHLNPSEGIKYDVIVTTFEMILDDLNAFRKIDWQYLIVDEAHKLKNDESRAHSALASLPTLHRLIITGTPLQNNLKELWALLHFLAPRLFHDSTTFDTWFDTASGQQDAQVMSDLHKMLAPLMIRRLKADVSTGIPPKKEVYVSCKLTKKQREWYMHVLANDAEALNKTSSGSTARLSNILMHLRKVINHPYLMDGGEDGPPFITDEKLVRSSGKMIILDKLLHRLRNDVEGQHKVLIFSQFTMMLDVLEDYCNMRGFKYCRIDGNTSAYDRDSRMANFNAPGSDSFLFLLSTRAGGLGINLQAANHVILYDSDWNPQMDLQAQDRAHRIGQKRRVRVYRFVTDGTVEERVYYRALKKLYLDAMVVQQGRIQSRSTSAASKEELLSMIKFGAEEIFQSRQDDVTEADIDKLLEAGEAKSAELTTEAQKTVQASLASFQLGAEEGNIYDFEGISFRGGVETRVLHMELPQPVSQAQLHAECSAYGEAIKVVLHPNLKEALVHFRSTAGAVEAKSGLPYTCTFVGRENQAVVSSEMIAECLGAGEKLGRGHRHREVRVYADEEVERLQNRAPKAPPLKLPKAPKFKFHQLFNMKRLMELHNTEVALLVRAWKRRYEVSNNTTTNANPDDATGRGGEGQENAASPVEPGSPGSPGQASTAGDEEDESLTEVEQEERERLLSEGFEHWTYREYRTIISALCSGDVGVTDYAALTKLVATAAEADDATPKTVGEVKDYLGALMERGERYIPNFGHLESRINKAQARHKLLEDTLRHARQKVETCELPERNLNVKVKGFTPLDRRLFLIGYDAGFAAGCCEQVARNLPELRFNVWAQSRGEGHYDRRLVTLMRAAYREVESAGDASMPPTSRRRREAA